MCRSRPGTGYLRLPCDRGIATKRHKKHKNSFLFFCAFCAFLWLFPLWRRCPTSTAAGAYRARRRVSSSLPVFCEAATAFGVESSILLAFDTGGLGLFISGGTIPETGRD